MIDATKRPSPLAAAEPMKWTCASLGLALALNWWAGCAGRAVAADEPRHSSAIAEPAAEPVAAQIAEHVAAGRALWKQSCPVTTVAGSCIAVEPRPANRRMCPQPGAMRIRVVDRSPDAVMQAVHHFGAAIALWANGEALGRERASSQAEQNRSDEAMIRAIAEAHFYLAEPVVERLLARELAPGVDLEQWLGEMSAALREPQTYYAPISDELQVAIVDPWRAAGLARMGQLSRHVAAELMTAILPREVSESAPAKQSYCTALETAVGQLREQAAALFERCAAIESGPWRVMCQQELDRAGRQR